jgi:hypothetical protein
MASLRPRELVTAFIPRELKAALVERARKEDCSASSVIRAALARHLEKEER